MKNSLKLILLMLALILALSLFASCAPEVPDEGTEAPTSADGITTDAPETEASESGDFTLVANGAGACKLVRPSELATDLINKSVLKSGNAEEVFSSPEFKESFFYGLD